ncbi:MAG: iron ABC transporter permease [Deltaproteobacteria bacterium]|nr:iron ABC transporter permease [Deltaproteobacteria bacterium]
MGEAVLAKRHSKSALARPGFFVGPHIVPLALSWIVLSAIVALSLFVLYMTFVPGVPTDPGYTLDHWKNIARPFLLTKVIPNTVIVGVGTVVVAVFFAGPLAWLLTRTTLPCRNLFMTLIAVVVIVPGFVTAMGWILLINKRIGLVNKAIAGLFGLQSVPLDMSNVYGMAWVMGLMLTPTVFFLISGPMRSMDPSLEEAAVVARANRWQTLLHVSLPLVWPGILGGAIYIFMTAISIFEVPALLGGAGKEPVLATELFYTVHPTQIGEGLSPPYGAAGAYGVLIAVPSLLALYFYQRVLARARKYEVITGKGYRPHLVDLGRFKYLGLGFVLFYLLLAVVLPLLMLVWSSLLPLLELPSMEALSKISLNNYYRALPALGGALIIRNTVLLMLSVTCLVLFFSFMISWIVVRTRLRIRNIMDTLAMLPHAIPGLAFAFALFMLGLAGARWFPWLPVQGTLAVIVLAHLLERLAYGTRITNAALLQVHRELEECARVCRARSLGIMWRVIVPLIKPSLVYAAVWTALLSFREVSIALFLQSYKSKVLSVAIWEIWSSGNLTIASAGAVMMVAVMGLLILLAMVLAGGRLLEADDSPEGQVFSTE